MAPSASTSAMATEARLASGLWVAALLRRLDLEAIPAYVTRRGDETAGAVMIKAVQRDGTAALFAREYDLQTDALSWVIRDQAAESEIDATLARECGFDPDLWLIEVEISAHDFASKLQ